MMRSTNLPNIVVTDVDTLEANLLYSQSYGYGQHEVPAPSTSQDTTIDVMLHKQQWLQTRTRKFKAAQS